MSQAVPIQIGLSNLMLAYLKRGHGFESCKWRKYMMKEFYLLLNQQ